MSVRNCLQAVPGAGVRVAREDSKTVIVVWTDRNLCQIRTYHPDWIWVLCPHTTRITSGARCSSVRMVRTAATKHASEGPKAVGVGSSFNISGQAMLRDKPLASEWPRTPRVVNGVPHLRLLSYNIQGGIAARGYRHYVTHSWKHVLPDSERLGNLDRIAELIHDFDLVGLQEVRCRQSAQRIRQSDGIPCQESALPTLVRSDKPQPGYDRATQYRRPQPTATHSDYRA